MQIGDFGPSAPLYGVEPARRTGQLGKLDPVNSTAGSSAPGPARQAELRAQAARDAQRAVLDEIRDKGIYAWAQEQKLEKLKEKIRAQVTAANPDADPAAIEDEVARQVKEAMEQALKTEAAEAAKAYEQANNHSRVPFPLAPAHS